MRWISISIRRLGHDFLLLSSDKPDPGLAGMMGGEQRRGGKTEIGVETLMPPSPTYSFPPFSKPGHQYPPPRPSLPLSISVQESELPQTWFAFLMALPTICIYYFICLMCDCLVHSPVPSARGREALNNYLLNERYKEKLSRLLAWADPRLRKPHAGSRGGGRCSSGPP